MFQDKNSDLEILPLLEKKDNQCADVFPKNTENIYTGYELLSPAGDFHSLYSSVLYGANAVYLGSDIFTMRVSPPNFSGEKLKEAVEFAHSKGVKVYLTCNTTALNHEIKLLDAFIENAKDASVDAFIAADFGVISILKKKAPSIPIHASTQMGVMNYASATALFEYGIKRVVLARELSISEIAEIRQNTPPKLELESFVHGAMCVAISGRCLLSKYLTGRDANRGACAQPCRWSYTISPEYSNPQKETNPLSIIQEENKSYILNSKDLCMIQHLKELKEAGITSFKIEGRAKTAYYAGIVTNAYRAALDAVLCKKPFPEYVKEELKTVSHRVYDTGFFFSDTEISNLQNTKSSSYLKNALYCAFVTKDAYCNENVLEITQRGYFTINDSLELILPGKAPFILKNFHIENKQGDTVTTANKADEKLILKLPSAIDFFIPRFSLIRKIL